MALNTNEAEAICWAEMATANLPPGVPGSRTRMAFKWVDGRRVASVDSRTGAQLIERLPLAAHRGSKLTGVTVATDIRSTMKVLRHDGILADIKINNGPAHEAGDDDRYHNHIKGKGRALGWIPVGECPAAMVANGVIAPHTVLADEARDGRPCDRSILGIRNPPCRHYLAEDAARVAKQKAKQAEREEAAKTEEARLMASNAEAVAANMKGTNALLEVQAQTQAQIATALAALAVAKPEKAGK